MYSHVFTHAAGDDSATQNAGGSKGKLTDRTVWGELKHGFTLLGGPTYDTDEKVNTWQVFVGQTEMRLACDLEAPSDVDGKVITQ